MSDSSELSASTGARLAYSELRRLAVGYLRRANPEFMLEPAALVNEAYIRLAQWQGVHWTSRSHFIGVAALVMRQVLWEQARRRNSLKRGAGGQRVSLHSDMLSHGGTLDALCLEEAMQRLERESREACRIVEMRVFGGLTVAEIAILLELPESKIKRQWAFAKTWLRRQIETKAVR